MIKTQEWRSLANVRKDYSLNRDMLNISNRIDSIFKTDDHSNSGHSLRARVKKYASGCTYEGEFDGSSWFGKGVYTFPHGTVYDGSFADSEFHGNGYLRYPMGQTLDSTWNLGKMRSWHYRFKDGLECADPWSYCIFPDRSYYSTIQYGYFKPPGKERLTNILPPRTIPKGCYDTGAGFYSPAMSTIIGYGKEVLGIPTVDEEAWIKKHCRKDVQGPVGYRPDLYEYWCSGTKESVNLIMQDINKSPKVKKEQGE